MSVIRSLMMLHEAMRMSSELEAVVKAAGKENKDAAAIMDRELDQVREDRPNSEYMNLMAADYGDHFEKVVASPGFPELLKDFRIDAKIKAVKAAGRRFAGQIKEMCPNSTLTPEWGEVYFLTALKATVSE